MISLEFTKKTPSGNIVWSQFIYENAKKDSPVLHPLVLEAMKHQQQEKIVDILIPDKKGFKRTLIARLNTKNSSTQKEREDVGAFLLKKAERGSDPILVLDVRNNSENVLDFLMGMLLSSWSFCKYQTKPKVFNAIEKIIVLCNEPDTLEKDFARRKGVVEGVFYARMLTSEPPNVFFPTSYAEKLQELEAFGVKVEILHEETLQKLGMSCLLAVGRSSCHPSCVAVLEWNGTGKKNSSPIAVVGKGVCFDSGGLCIKNAIHQHDMKWDKAGAGVVAGLIKTLALNKSPSHVVGIIGLVENMPDGKAMKPGDVVTTMSGQTVEIVNTDAEGRLVLADCLWYAQERFQPKAIIDLGTLTQETFAALGGAYAGLFSNNKDFTESLKKAGEISGDQLWELPMGDYFAKQIESPIADIRNLGINEFGESGAAAEFLRRFITCKAWAHIDIAGVSWIKEDMPTCTKGVTGFGVRLLEEWINGRFL